MSAKRSSRRSKRKRPATGRRVTSPTRLSFTGDTMKPEKQLFAYSIIYLFALFAALVADHWLVVQGVTA